MSRKDLEPLDLDFDWGEEERTMPSIPSTPMPPSSGIEWVKLSASSETESWGLEWVEDINETPHMFEEDEIETMAETPDAKRGDTMRAAPPPPNECGSPTSVKMPSLAPSRRRELVREAVAVVTLMAQRRAG